MEPLTGFDAIRHLCGWGLPGGPTNPIDLSNVRHLAGLAQKHRVTGVVLAAIEDGAATGVTDHLVDDLEERHRTLIHQSLASEADMVVVVRELTAAGIDSRVLKGCATAHLDYADPNLRVTSDADLLVPRGRLGDATEVLARLVDWQHSIPDRRRSWTDRYAKDRTLKLSDGSWLDLHQMLVRGYWGLTMNHEELFTDGEVYVVGGTELCGLSARHRLLHALLHAGFTHAVKIQSFRDVAVISSSIEAQLDDFLDSIVEIGPVVGLAAKGIARSAELVPLDRRLVDWAERASAGTRERLGFAVSPGTGLYRTGPLALPPSQWPAYLLPMAFPSRRYLDAIGRGRLAHLVAPIRATRAGRRRSATPSL